LDDRGSILCKGRDFSHRHRVQTGSGAHSPAYPTGTGEGFPGVKRLEREADHSFPFSAKVKEVCGYTPLPHVSL